ncbi:MAG: hypothetical protein H5T34_03310 [Candidatus Methanomethyliales bacterium]|nr:hypothetical protein [Candidatus Methanomethylicales archaeon]
MAEVCELPTDEDRGLPASKTGLDPHTPTAEASADETVPMEPVWKAGYGGLGLRRRDFGLPHA